MFRNYLKTAFRHLSRNKIYSAINIAGLTLGLACAMLIILYTRDELSFDRFHANVDNMYRITTQRVQPDGKVENMSGISGYFQGPRFTAGIPEIKSFVRWQANYKDLKQGTEIKGKEVFYADTNFFSFFSFPLLGGNPQTCLLQPKSVVLSEKMAIEQFGTVNAVGQTMQIKNESEFEPYVVTAVAKRIPENSSVHFDIIMPMLVSATDEQRNENWFNFFLNTFVSLTPGSDISKVEAKMKKVYESDAAESIKMVAEKYGDKATTVHGLQHFTGMHLSKNYTADGGLRDSSKPMYSYILSGIAFFILLIACINFVNLTIARSLKRAKEIGVRKVTGSSRGQLITQFLGESFLLSLIAFVLAIWVVQLILPTFNHLANKALSVSYLFDITLVAGYAGLFMLTGLLAGFYPALVLSRYNPVQTLYSKFRLAGKNYLQKSLVILQFAIATILIIATIIIYSQFKFLTTKELGYDASNVISVEKWGMTRPQAKLFKEELMKNPNILNVAPKNGGRWGTVARVNGETEMSFDYETIDEAYLPMYRIALVKGRNFSAAFPSDSTHSVLVNESFVQKAGWKEPIGQEVNFWYNEREKYTVIGVVKDYHYRPLNETINPQLYTMKPGNDYGMAFIKIRPNSEAASLQHIEKVFKQLFPLSPYSYGFKERQNREYYESEEKWQQMMLFGAILTIFISSIGLFGLSVLAAEKRTKEIGIRKVLGAPVGQMVIILSRDFLKLVTIAMLIAMPVAWLLSNKWLQDYPYRVTLNGWMFAAAGLLVVLIALFTVSFQAIKAAVANPVKSLRTE